MSRYADLKDAVCAANLELAAAGLIVLTWGNASQADRDAGAAAIKPSGVSYNNLTPDDIVVVSLEDGAVIEGDLNPSSDTATHLVLYREFSDIGGVVHTHSTYATGWAQAGKPIPCFGTTHADSFYGPVPVTRHLTPGEIAGDYEENTGKVIVEYYSKRSIDAAAVPAVLIPCHGPFTWGPGAKKAVENAIVLEEVAKMASIAAGINPELKAAPQELQDKHYLRKHGPNAYYGQKS